MTMKAFQTKSYYWGTVPLFLLIIAAVSFKPLAYTSDMRKIKKIHRAESHPIHDLKTYSPLPSHELEQVDPFIFLNHHGPQVYKPNNKGLPFGPHPHRGMETVTFILEGDIMHQDTAHHKSVIKSGGIQWMTAGSGLIHAELSSEEFKQNGGPLEILQLWVNLPARLKMTTPFYEGFQKDQIPTLVLDNGKITAQVISGEFMGTKGAHTALTDVQLNTLFFKTGAKFEYSVPVSKNIFFYIVRGKLKVNGQEVPAFHLVEFSFEGEKLEVEATEESILIFGTGTPFNEPFVSDGPFVMNTQEEIRQAYKDFREGKFGKWIE